LQKGFKQSKVDIFIANDVRRIISVIIFIPIKIITMEENTLNQKIANQQKLISELTDENEKLYQQFNHLMVRNSKLLKRIDDLQQIIDGMHLRVEELQLINQNLLKINDGERKDIRVKAENVAAPSDDMRNVIDNINRRIDELNLRNDVLQKRASLFSQYSNSSTIEQSVEENLSPKVNMEKLLTAWKNYPGQDAKNAPNLRRQMQMLVHLYQNESLNSGELFLKTGVNGVSGARYVARLKKFNLIVYGGARKNGKYTITDKGRTLVESTLQIKEPLVFSEAVTSESTVGS
jgi:predicted transcriptional regulator